MLYSTTNSNHSWSNNKKVPQAITHRPRQYTKYSKEGVQGDSWYTLGTEHSPYSVVQMILKFPFRNGSNREYFCRLINNTSLTSGSAGKESACHAGDTVESLGWGDPLEKDMTTYSSVLAWRIPWTEEPGRLQSMGSQRVGHDLATKEQRRRKNKTKSLALHHPVLDWLFLCNEVEIILTVYHRRQEITESQDWIQDLKTKSHPISITTTWTFGKKQKKQVRGHLS